MSDTALPAAPSSTRRWLVGGLAVALAALCVLLPVGDLSRQLTTWIADLGKLGMVAYLALFVVWGMILPKGPLVAFAGVAFGLVEGLLIVYLGATVAMTCGFWLARRFGQQRARAWMARHPWADACDRALATRGTRLVLLLRLSPVIPGHLQNYIYGLSRVPFGPCLIASWLGILPYTALLVAGGALFGGAGQGFGPWTWALSAGGLVATAVAGTIVVRAARRELRAAGIATATDTAVA